MLAQKKAKWGYLFILPNLLGFLVFTLVPVASSLFISFTDWNVYKNFRYIGLNNYINLFSDKVFIKALTNTIYLSLLTIPAGIALALMMAVLLNKPVKGIPVFRVCVFIPVVTSMASVALVWTLIYNTDFGLLNIVLNAVGLPSVGWLTDGRIAIVSIALMTVWKGLGYTMTIYLAGLQGIPAHLYEAAQIDGAKPLRQFWHITLPLLSPTTYFITVISIISTLQIFDQVYIMTGGGPASDTQTIVMYLYMNAFKFLKMGYASAMAYILFAIIFVLSLIQHKYSKKWAEITY